MVFYLWADPFNLTVSVLLLLLAVIGYEPNEMQSK